MRPSIRIESLTSRASSQTHPCLYSLSTCTTTMKSSYLFALSLALFVSCCGPAPFPMSPATITPAFDEAKLLKTWWYDWRQAAALSDSFKKLYVADGQPLPPARGRTGMTFEKGGKYTYIGIAPADGPLPFSGSWKWISPTHIHVQHEAKMYQGASFSAVSDTLEILSLSDTVLVARHRQSRF